jgi:hypothetical protein
MSRRPTSLEELEGLARTMAGSPAQAVSMAASMADKARELPPPRSELLSRPLWARGSLWTEGVSFEFVPNDGSESPPQIIRLQHDMWIRGVEACALFQAFDDPENLLEAQAGLNRSFGSQNRWAAEANWRVDARQGFVSSGQAEILAPLNTIAGDGSFSAALDWKLQKDQTIEVRARSRLGDVLGPIAKDEDNGFLIRWLVVTFFGESLRMPGVQ